MVFCFGCAGLLHHFLYCAQLNRYWLFLHRLVQLFYGAAFRGPANSREIFSPERDYTDYIVNTLWFTIAETTFKTVFALGLAVLLSRKVSALNFHRCIAYLPSVLSVLIVSLVFVSILNPKNGFLNEFLRAVGLDFMAQKWLTDPKLAMWSVIFVDVWRGTGYIMNSFCRCTS